MTRRGFSRGHYHNLVPPVEPFGADPLKGTPKTDPAPTGKEAALPKVLQLWMVICSAATQEWSAVGELVKSRHVRVCIFATENPKRSTATVLLYGGGEEGSF